MNRDFLPKTIIPTLGSSSIYGERDILRGRVLGDCEGGESKNEEKGSLKGV